MSDGLAASRARTDDPPEAALGGRHGGGSAATPPSGPGVGTRVDALMLCRRLEGGRSLATPRPRCAVRPVGRASPALLGMTGSELSFGPDRLVRLAPRR